MSEYQSFLQVERHHHMLESNRAYVNAVAARTKRVTNEWTKIACFHDDKVAEYTRRLDSFK